MAFIKRSGKSLLRYCVALCAVLLLNFTIGCGPEYTDDGDPCTDPELWNYPIGNTYNELDTTFLKYFPYDSSRKTLTYLFSDESHYRDTMIFQLITTEFLNIENGVAGASPCDTIFTEVKKYYYEAKKPVKKSFTVQYDGNSFLFDFGYYSPPNYPVLGLLAQSHESWKDSFVSKDIRYENAFVSENESYGVKIYYTAKSGFALIHNTDTKKPDTLFYVR